MALYTSTYSTAEEGDLSEEETIEMFQKMIDDGSAWTLQGCYGRTAKALIDAGLCHRKVV